MRLKTLCQKIREVGRVARGGEDRIQYDLSAGAMIGVIDAVDGKQRLRITSEENIGFVSADLADYHATRIKIGNEVAIRIFHKMHRLSADDFCGFILFFMPNGT